MPDAEGLRPVDWATAAGHASVLSLLGSARPGFAVSRLQMLGHRKSVAGFCRERKEPEGAGPPALGLLLRELCKARAPQPNKGSEEREGSREVAWQRIQRFCTSALPSRLFWA